MASKVTVDPGKLTRFSAKILQKAGVPLEDAERTAGMLVAADTSSEETVRTRFSKAGLQLAQAAGKRLPRDGLV